MTQRGLFRVLMKAVGLCASLYGGITLFGQIVVQIRHNMSVAQTFGGVYPEPTLAQYLVVNLVPTAYLLVGLYLFFAGRFILDLAFPRGPSRCHECGYDLSGNDTDICPECATKVIRVQQAQGETP
ncbi:MAG: hypothetical protein KDA16_02630 [Phycisphaerales bacterium]|nr:hypothetical protein [Phycisphaerales bacterium]